MSENDKSKLLGSTLSENAGADEKPATELSPLKIDLSGPGFVNIVKEDVPTSRGSVHVAIQGDRSHKTCILTLHDIGLDYISGFQTFFCFHQVQPLLKHFAVYHINFPGQNEDAPALDENYVYPSMDEMVDVIKEILDYYRIKDCICIGVGAGANVFLRFGIKYPNPVEGLVLVNGTCHASTWTEWGYQKVSSHYLKGKGMTKFTEDYLLWHYFGKSDEQQHSDMTTVVRDHLHRIKHTRNLALFIDSFVKRNAINIIRPAAGSNKESTHPNSLLICGSQSPFLDDTVDLNSKLDPRVTQWIKVSDATGMVLDEQPTVVLNALILFLQGLGHGANLRPPSLSIGSEPEVDAGKSI